MYFSRSLLLGASCLLALAQAQTTTPIAFTKQPATVKAGEPVSLGWSGGDGSAVTITLKQGDPTDLKTVTVITGDASGTSFTWNPPADLPSGDDYALQISQGQDDVNYSGQFSYSGGSDVVSSVSVKASSATAVSVSSRVSASKTSVSAASVTSAASASVSSLVSSLQSVINKVSSSSRPVVTTVIPLNVTTVPVGTGAIGTGTGGLASRNTTLSLATLSKTKTVTTSVPATQTAARTTGTAGSTSGTSESSPSSTPNNGATSMASPLAFVVSAFVAIMYLG